MISSIRCLRSALSSWLDTMDPLPGLGLMVPPYDAPPTSTGTNRASYFLRSRLPRSHNFSASFSRRSRSFNILFEAQRLQRARNPFDPAGLRTANSAVDPHRQITSIFVYIRRNEQTV